MKNRKAKDQQPPSVKNDSGKGNASGDDTAPVNKRPFLKMAKKVGFSIWMIVMLIGGALAFIVSLFLL